MKQRSKRFISLIMLLTCCLILSTPVSAGTIDFNITVGNADEYTQDPMSKKEIKTSDNDMYAYFRATAYRLGWTPVYARSINYNNSSIYSGRVLFITQGLVNIGASNLNQTLKNSYNQYQGGVYYYMNTEAYYAGIASNILGKYCP